MEWLITTILLIATILFFWFRIYSKNPIKIGQSAPNFEAIDQHGNLHTLENFKGKWLVMYFYPKDDTPGCTKQACAFRDDLKKLSDLDAQVIGISVDNTLSHAEFANKYNLPFPLLADNKTDISKKYYSLINLGIIKFAQRNTFLIDPQGRIAKVYLSVSATRNSTDIIEDLKHLHAM